jgi:hypothetical protein
VPLCRRHAFRKYDSTCLAVVGAQLWSLANLGTSSGEAHRLAARKTDMVRLDIFAVHQPQCRFFNRAARCSKEHTNPLTRDKAAKGAQNPFQLGVRTAVQASGSFSLAGNLASVLAAPNKESFASGCDPPARRDTRVVVARNRYFTSRLRALYLSVASP